MEVPACISAEEEQKNRELIQSLYNAAPEDGMFLLLSHLTPDTMIRYPDGVALLGGIYRGQSGASVLHGKWKRIISPGSKLLALCSGGSHVIGVRTIFTADEDPCETTITECWKIVDNKIVELSTFFWDAAGFSQEVRKRFFHGRVPFQPYIC